MAIKLSTYVKMMQAEECRSYLAMDVVPGPLGGSLPGAADVGAALVEVELATASSAAESAFK